MQTYPNWPNLAAMMFSLARAWPDKPMLRAWHNGAWVGTSWGEFGRRAASCARHLRAAGVSAGDRVLICAENRPDYPVAEIALMAIRAVPVPTYTTNTIDDHAHVLRDSGARVAIVSTPALAEKLRAAAARASGLDLLVVMDTLEWSALLADTASADDIAAEAAGIPRTALACLIYTSGTGGAPRGVMLPHRCILSNCAGAFELVRPLKLKDETYLSYLPVSHSYEHTVGQFFLLSLGTEIVYSRGADHLAADLQTIRPTILTAVPRVLELIRGRILSAVARQPKWKRYLFHQALALGLKKVTGAPLPLHERAFDSVLDVLVRAKIHARFGGRMVAMISGGARLDPEVGRFFLAMGMKILQGYGQTEAGPVISATPPEAIRIETVGLPLEGVDLRIAEDGEILVRGELVMDGYWGRPHDTAAVIQNGWLHTGDVGCLDEAGNLTITDRKKDLIVLSGGENVSPAKVEGMLMAEAAIAQAVIAGDGRAGLTGLLVAADDCDEGDVARAVSRTNHRLSVTERIRKYALVTPFTVENGFLTPTQKIRRMMVIQANRDVLAKLHG